VIVENLLDWAAAILQETDSALATEVLTERLSHQVHGTLDKLEVLLSLDKRFLRNTNGGWQLNIAHMSEESLANLVNQALTLRERAIEALLKERQVAEDEADNVRKRLEEINDSLDQLGHQPAGAAVRVTRHEGPYSLEYHLNGLPQKTHELALQVHEAILGLPDARSTFNKYHIAYSTHQRFAVLMTRKSKLVIHVRADVGFEDPEGWTRDAASRRLGMERIFDLADAKGLEYAMRLVRQSYRLVAERGG
jgi:predicted transport protein